MKFIQITNDPVFATECRAAGVDRIMVDLEIMGKAQRQGHMDTLISDHSLDDVAAITQQVSEVELMVRVNPWHENSCEEIEQVVALGADIVMLPMFRTSREVNHFVETIAGRSKTCLLFETASAVARVDDILACRGIDEVYVGLNDLHIEMHLDFMFELVSGGLVPMLAQRFVDAGVAFGFGGVAPMRQGLIGPRPLLGEHVRLGSSRVILSRGFRRWCESGGLDARQACLTRELGRLRYIIDQWNDADDAALIANAGDFRMDVRRVLGVA